ncbi:MAG TPA: hypothetical protein VGV65_02345 [Nocardioides sp.]|nr:hypothetical protein [Nocardioides sp.]
MQMVNRLRRGVAVVAATALVCTPLLLAPVGASASPASVTGRAAMPHITATLTKKTITLKGAGNLRPGRVKLSVMGKGTVEFAMFKAGYDVADFTADVNRFGAENDAKALQRALKNTSILGGLTGGGTGTIVFPKPGAYTPISLGQRGVVTGKTLVVRGPARSSKAPSTDGSIIGKNGPSWGGASQLPMKGRLLFKNKADEPHFVVMQQVAEGTTTDQVLEALQSQQEGPPPSWFLPAGMETGTLSPGRSMTVDYDLPAGQYVLMCFFPDPKMGGMPHSLMGMLKMVHLT